MVTFVLSQPLRPSTLLRSAYSAFTQCTSSMVNGFESGKQTITIEAVNQPSTPSMHQVIMLAVSVTTLGQARAHCPSVGATCGSLLHRWVSGESTISSDSVHTTLHSCTALASEMPSSDDLSQS